MSGSDHVVEVEILTGIAINDGELTATIAPKLLTAKIETGYYTINTNTIKVIRWSVKEKGKYLVRIYEEDQGVLDIDCLDSDNQMFLYNLVGPQWKKYLHPSHKAQYDEWVANLPKDY